MEVKTPSGFMKGKKSRTVAGEKVHGSMVPMTSICPAWNDIPSGKFFTRSTAVRSPEDYSGR